MTTKDENVYHKNPIEWLSPDLHRNKKKVCLSVCFHFLFCLLSLWTARVWLSMKNSLPTNSIVSLSGGCFLVFLFIFFWHTISLGNADTIVLWLSTNRMHNLSASAYCIGDDFSAYSFLSCWLMNVILQHNGKMLYSEYLQNGFSFIVGSGHARCI